MSERFLSKDHPWNILKRMLLEAASFPDNNELLAMKGIMDGKSIGQTARELSVKNDEVKELLKSGMAKANVKNLYELIVFGLRSGVIKDNPVDVKSIERDFYKKGFYEAYPLWLYVLNQIAIGKTFQDIEREGGAGSKSSIQNARKQIADKYGLGDSLAKYIRFAFAAVNPITGPGSTRGYKPHVSWAQKAGVGSKLPLIPSKFRPSDVDPNIPVYDKMAKRDMPPGEREQKPKVQLPPRPKGAPTTKVPPPVTRTTPVQTALYLLGIDRNVISPPSSAGSFWERPPEHLWNMLELAKKRYTYEMAHAHPDRGGSAQRAAQLTAAWNLTKKLFARRGFVLHK